MYLSLPSMTRLDKTPLSNGPVASTCSSTLISHRHPTKRSKQFQRIECMCPPTGLTRLRNVFWPSRAEKQSPMIPKLPALKSDDRKSHIDAFGSNQRLAN